MLKGDEDIRLVYDRTRSRVNQIIWAPSFFLLTSISFAQILEVNTYQLNMDVGEMFLNFPLNKTIRPYYRVNLTSFRNDIEEFTNEYQFRCNMTWMGFSPSPYLAV